MQGLWSADAVGLAHAAEAADVDGPVHVSALDSEKPAQETGSIEETSPKKKPRKRRRKTRRNPSAIDEVSAAPQPEEGLPHPNRTAVETDGTSLLALKDRAARATREPGQPGTEPAVLSDPEAASGPAAGADAFPDAADAVEDTEGKPKKRKRRARRRRSKAKKAAPAPQTTLTPEEEAALAAAEAAARKRASTYSRPLPVAPPRPDGPEASFLRPTRTGVIRMRGRTDKGRRWYQETDLETAVTLVREHAAVVVNRSTIRRLYSNKKFRSYILNRDRYTCFFCGEYGDTIDHLLPRAKGGHTTPVNCVCACSICNQSKADRHLDDFLDSRGEAE
ncbi:hypothetical protein J31TS4_04430 [Paenibacillus sp. J31TS4]|nr:hypothetical protein J31TS4_04430 [Paenibacillus sp. J31TS4]